jgi:Uma2 family endonuclease
MDQWMTNGAQLAWLVDPIRKLSIVCRPGQQPEMLHKPEVLEGEGPIAGFRLEMGRLWA